jgi:hypothetical protein
MRVVVWIVIKSAEIAKLLRIRPPKKMDKFRSTPNPEYSRTNPVRIPSEYSGPGVLQNLSGPDNGWSTPESEYSGGSSRPESPPEYSDKVGMVAFAFLPKIHILLY